MGCRYIESIHHLTEDVFVKAEIIILGLQFFEILFEDDSLCSR